MADRLDVVVAGAGHNSLIAAAYLAKAGFRCLVLEGRPVVGGNCVTVVPPEWPMSGRLAYSLVHGRQRWSWCVPKGGSGAFSGALARLIEAHGGVILTGKSVRRLIVEHGRCAGVECADGSAYRANKA